VRPELLDRLTTVGGFCHQDHIRLNPHETADTFAHKWMVVHCEDPDRRAIAHDRKVGDVRTSREPPDRFKP